MTLPEVTVGIVFDRRLSFHLFQRKFVSLTEMWTHHTENDQERKKYLS